MLSAISLNRIQGKKKDGRLPRIQGEASAFHRRQERERVEECAFGLEFANANSWKRPVPALVSLAKLAERGPQPGRPNQHREGIQL
jgi:hypothetical protein